MKTGICFDMSLGVSPIGAGKSGCPGSVGQDRHSGSPLRRYSLFLTSACQELRVVIRKDLPAWQQL